MPRQLHLSRRHSRRPRRAIKGHHLEQWRRPTGEPIWRSLIEVTGLDLPTSILPRIFNQSATEHRWIGPWSLPLLRFFCLSWAHRCVLVFKTNNGAIVLKDIPENAEASFEGEQGKLKLPGRSDPIEIRRLFQEGVNSN